MRIVFRTATEAAPVIEFGAPVVFLDCTRNEEVEATFNGRFGNWYRLTVNDYPTALTVHGPAGRTVTPI